MSGRSRHSSRGEERPEERKEKEKVSLFTRTKIGGISLVETRLSLEIGTAARLTQNSSRLSYPQNSSSSSSNTNRDASLNSISSDTSLNDSSGVITSRMNHIRKSIENPSLNTVLETNVSSDMNNPSGMASLSFLGKPGRVSETAASISASIKRNDIHETPLPKKIRVDSTPNVGPSIYTAVTPSVEKSVGNSGSNPESVKQSTIQKKEINTEKKENPPKVHPKDIEEESEESTSMLSQPSIYCPVTSMHSPTKEKTSSAEHQEEKPKENEIQDQAKSRPQRQSSSSKSIVSSQSSLSLPQEAGPSNITALSVTQTAGIKSQYSTQTSLPANTMVNQFSNPVFQSPIPSSLNVLTNQNSGVFQSTSPDLLYNMSNLNVYPALFPALVKNQNSHLKPIIVFLPLSLYDTIGQQQVLLCNQVYWKGRK